MMRVDLDKNLCEINGICIGIAPDIFALDDNDELAVANPVSAARANDVNDAVAQCPRAALRIAEQEL